MARKMIIQIIIILALISLISTDKKKKKKSSIKKNKITKEGSPSLYEWAKKNNISINENITLNKNTDSSHNFYYFTSNKPIHNNTILLKVPYDIMISPSSLDKHFKDKKSKKFQYLWEKVISNRNPFISYFSTKQLFYMSILIENAINKKKGSLYQKYKPYFDMYEYMDMDFFPIFFGDEEIIFLSQSVFGSQLGEAVESLKEEYYIINNDLHISTSMQETFLKYRVLALANSISFNNTKLNFKENVVVPFIDCFKRVVNINSDAEYSIKEEGDGKYYLEVRAIRDIPKDEEISLKWMRLPNNECYIFYGFIEKNNYLVPKFSINVFNNLFKKDLGVDTKNEYNDIINRKNYELNTEFLQPHIVECYYNLSKLFDKYKDKPEGKYEMMADNLYYYLNLYNEQYNDGSINLYVKGNQKQKIIKHLMKFEKLIVQKKMDEVKDIIKNIKEGKKKPSEDL